MDDAAHYLYLLAALVILLGIYISGGDHPLVGLLIFAHFLLLIFKATCNHYFIRLFFGVRQRTKKANADDEFEHSAPRLGRRRSDYSSMSPPDQDKHRFKYFG